MKEVRDECKLRKWVEKTSQTHEKEERTDSTGNEARAGDPEVIKVKRK